jgi:MarR-like DNA-binding transcriptional regulator SgrR of sgrS sRNA
MTDEQPTGTQRRPHWSDVSISRREALYGAVVTGWEPDVTIPFGLASFTATMIPEGYRNTGRRWQDGQVGTGPFRLASFSPGQSIRSRSPMCACGRPSG